MRQVLNKGYVKLPNVVEDTEKSDLQASDHRYKICVDILNMSESIKKKTLSIIKNNYIYICQI